MTKKEENVIASQFSGQEVPRSIHSTEEVTVNLDLPSQKEQGTIMSRTYSSRDGYKIATTPKKKRNSEEVVETSECSG